MSNLSDNDMDGLFQRASERYPLRTDSADWDRMAAALDQEPSVLLGVDEDRGRRRRWAWLLLLLPLAGIGYWTINWATHKKGDTAVYAVKTAPASNGGQSTTSASGEANGAAEAAASAENAGTGKAKDATPDGRIDATPDGTKDANSGSANGAAGTAAGSEVSGSTANTAFGRGSRGAKTPGNTSVAVTNGATDNADNSVDNTIASTSNAAPGRGNNRIKGLKNRKDNRSADLGNGDGGYAATGNNTNAAKGNRGMTTNDDFADTQDGASGKSAGQNVTRGDNADAAKGNRAIAANEDSANTRSWIDPSRAGFSMGYSVKAAALVIKKDSVAKKKASVARKNSFIYAGVIGAPDYSTIHLQASKGVGTTFGVLVGYAFNSHWAIETGAYIETKKYYTKGEYFNTKSLNLTANESINNLDGTCSMWEIPINIRYNFNTEGNFRWFATAGISTYLMTDEKYTALYQASNYGTTVTWPKQVQWKGGDNYLFSIFNFSGGFEQRIGRLGNLRIEPYWRIPLSGLGHGNLSIMSTGLNIGFTRRLW